ncbi:hypothetical protein F0562_008147 [Nyssa sinensis]|uniref:Uncharacterized protein n=1 Tax=Nyssa sinensis TaxID=561372 RepID=A0A5J5A827_9ASTE|nr:hypothetical protein F0562_008147 [Nyssa sinensis]
MFSNFCATIYFKVLAATQTPGEAGKKWFQGTADAVRQFHWLFEKLQAQNLSDAPKFYGLEPATVIPAGTATAVIPVP